MKLNNIINAYKNQIIFQIVCIIWIIVLLTKIGIWGFEFGRWIAH